jgi:hypothetical protein
MIGEVKGSGMLNYEVTHPFQFPLTLAFFQFAFMGLVFSLWWLVSCQDHAAELSKAHENLVSTEWGGLVTTHVFSTFWLQSLMMPATVMTPMVFAASRALEVPAAAALRSQVIGSRYGGHPLFTTALMFGAASLLIYSQTQIAECLCMWSGHGVQLAGVALIVIYGFLLILPAANAVCLEAVMVNFNVSPTLMLAGMNILACILFGPVLAFAHFIGWENVIHAVTVTSGTRELYMLVLWLGVQTTLLSALQLGLIGMLDSFWAVSLRSFKAVYWWCGQLAYMFFFDREVLSIDRPNASFWAFIMFCGVLLVGAAAVTDAMAPNLHNALTKAEGEKV